MIDGENTYNGDDVFDGDGDDDDDFGGWENDDDWNDQNDELPGDSLNDEVPSAVNSNTIELTVMGGNSGKVQVSPGERMTVAEAFSKAELSIAGCEILVNGDKVPAADFKVGGGDVCMAARELKAAN